MSDGISDNIGFCSCGPDADDLAVMRLQTFRGQMERLLTLMQESDCMHLILEDKGIEYFLVAQHHSCPMDFAHIKPCLVDKLVKKGTTYVEEKVMGYKMIRCDKQGKPLPEEDCYDVTDHVAAVSALYGLLVAVHAEQ